MRQRRVLRMSVSAERQPRRRRRDACFVKREKYIRRNGRRAGTLL